MEWEVVHTSEEGVVTVAPDYRKTEKMLSLAQRDKLWEIAAELAWAADVDAGTHPRSVAFDLDLAQGLEPAAGGLDRAAGIVEQSE